MQSLYSSLADATLLLHGLIVAFSIGALPLTWVGYFRQWKLARDPYFRGIHLLLLAFVLTESVFGAVCPLTALENSLRARAGAEPLYQDRGYVSFWLQRLIYWNFSPSVFIALYALFFALVLFTFVRIRPVAPPWWPCARPLRSRSLHFPLTPSAGPRLDRQARERAGSRPAEICS